jgi:ferredoxin
MTPNMVHYIIQIMTKKATVYIQDTCIACDNCVRLAPETFALTPDQLMVYVKQQPESDTARHRCHHAQAACPVQAIGLR